MVDRWNNSHHNVMRVLVLYLNQQNVMEHHVHLGKYIETTWTTLTTAATTKARDARVYFHQSTRQHLDNIYRYEPNFLSKIFAFMIVSALDVDDDEGIYSLDISLLTILSGSNCLNCNVGFC